MKYISTVHKKMHTITLYRIKTVRRTPRPCSYYVSQAYRIHTGYLIEIPEDYRLHGAHMDKNYYEWFENYIIPIIEHHMGDQIIDKWAATQQEDPAHLTIAVCVNNVLINPDTLLNTTQCYSSPAQHKLVTNAIVKAIQEYDTNGIVQPPYDEEWAQDAQREYMSALRLGLKM